MKDPELKRAFYSCDDVVENYDQFRFKNKGGLYVHNQELTAARNFWNRVEKSKPVLDIPVGTGRFSSSLKTSGFNNIIGADYSPSMLQFCKNQVGEIDYLCRQDAFNIGLTNNSIGLILSMRFFFHYADTSGLLKEFRRILSNEGYLILDTTTWSPRTWIPVFNKRLGGEIYTHSQKEFEALAVKAGFSIEDKTEILMMPSFIYNFIPDFLIPFVRFIDQRYPKILKTKCVWLLKAE